MREAVEEAAYKGRPPENLIVSLLVNAPDSYAGWLSSWLAEVAGRDG